LLTTLVNMVVAVLPKFEVSIIHPGPVLSDASVVPWRVCAQYVVNFCS